MDRKFVYDKLATLNLSNLQKNEIFNLLSEVAKNSGSNSGEKPKLKIYLYSKDGTGTLKIDNIEYIMPSNGNKIDIKSKELNDKYKNHSVHDIIFIFIPSLEQPEVFMEVSPIRIERNGDSFAAIMKIEELNLELGVVITY